MSSIKHSHRDNYITRIVQRIVLERTSEGTGYEIEKEYIQFICLSDGVIFDEVVIRIEQFINMPERREQRSRNTEVPSIFTEGIPDKTG